MRTIIPNIIERLEVIYHLANKSKDSNMKEISAICIELKDWLEVKFKGE